jgi:hypothetical protein
VAAAGRKKKQIDRCLDNVFHIKMFDLEPASGSRSDLTDRKAIQDYVWMCRRRARRLKSTAFAILGAVAAILIFGFWLFVEADMLLSRRISMSATPAATHKTPASPSPAQTP